MKKTTKQQRLVAAVAAVLGIGAGAVLSTDDASAGRLVTGKQIVDGSLTGKDLRDRTVTSRDVRDGSLSPDDYEVSPDAARAGDELTGLLVGADGPRGPQGPKGPPGPRGWPGIDGLVVNSAQSDVAALKYGNVTTTCPAGTRALAGGVYTQGSPDQVPIHTSAPLDQGAGWHSLVKNNSATVGAVVTGYVVCATAS